jgi:hypothetical protein
MQSRTHVARNSSGGVQSPDLKARLGWVASTLTTIAMNSTSYVDGRHLVLNNPSMGLG